MYSTLPVPFLLLTRRFNSAHPMSCDCAKRSLYRRLTHRLIQRHRWYHFILLSRTTSPPIILRSPSFRSVKLPSLLLLVGQMLSSRVCHTVRDRIGSINSLHHIPADETARTAQQTLMFHSSLCLIFSFRKSSRLCAIHVSVPDRRLSVHQVCSSFVNVCTLVLFSSTWYALRVDYCN